MRNEIDIQEAGQPLWVLDQAITVLVDERITAGAYAMVEQVVPAAGGLPFLHSYPTKATFYVSSGRFEFYQMDQRGKKQTLLANARSLVQIPKGGVHGFRNIGVEAGRLLVTFEPAGTMMRLFHELDRLARQYSHACWCGQLININELIGVFQKHELRIFEAPVER